MVPSSLFFFFLNNPATTETYPLPRPAALPIWAGGGTSVSSSRSRPPVARITQARIGGLGQERRGHHQLGAGRSEEHTSELQSQSKLVCRLLLEKKKGRSITAARGPLTPRLLWP